MKPGLLIVLAGLVVLAGCGGPPPGPTGTPAGGTSPATTTGGTSAPPTATTEALAARVNGVPITLVAYQRAVARCEAGELALGLDPARSQCKVQQLDELIERVLIRQEAEKMGLAIGDADVDAQLLAMKNESGPEKFQQWLKDNQYADESELREDLRAQLLGAQLFVQVTGSVPATAEQIHARHILLASAADAQDVLGQLQAGADFAQLAQQRSLDESTRPTGGDLGFFYRGLLTVPEVEAAAFELQPGQISGVVQSARGFHIVQVLERDPQHPLSPDDLQHLREQTFERWVAGLWSNAQVERLVQPGP